MLNWQITWVQELIKQAECRNADTEASSIKSPDRFYQAQQALFSRIKQQNQWKLYQQLIKQKQYIHTSVNTLMFIENMLLLWLEAGK